MENVAIENLSHDVLTIRQNTANFLRNIESDLRVLRNSSLLSQYIAEIDNEKITADTSIVREIKSEFLAFVRTKQIYYQIRIINHEGDELLRIEPDTLGESRTTYHAVSGDELRHGYQQFYFLLVNNLSQDQIAFVPSELVWNDDRRVPVISFAMPLIGSGGRREILIANVFARDLFRVIEAKRHLHIEGNIVLVSGDGHYLYHSEKKKDWNKLLASREEDNLQHDYPPRVAKLILSGNEGIVTEELDEIVSYAPLFPIQSTTEKEKAVAGFVLPYFVLESVSKDLIMAPVHSFTKLFAGFLTLFLVVAIGLGLLATRQFTKPIAELHRGAQVISKGAYNHRINVETHDEIEKLANEFNTMATSLEKHEKEIQIHRTKLEEMVIHRTAELSDEKAKLQAILDHVPSAIVLLDKDFRIQSASAAFSVITGHRFEDVRGSDCRTVFYSNGFCKECVCRRAMRTGKTESHIDVTQSPTMRERFIEHIAIPMSDNGTVESVLEIITDVTERKRFEQNLLRAERLAAAGEMSAIIAHEFRNSLTSIKMILQLQNESTRLRRTERTSLNVAMNAIEEMEQVVTQMLDFARPKPMQLKAVSLNQVISESLSLVFPQIMKLEITLRKELEESLPFSFLDEASMKEAITNILLNAIQAVSNREVQTPCGEISILTKNESLPKTLRDFVPTERSLNLSDSDMGTEILLKKGTHCLIVEIKDNGGGIQRQHLQRIFDPFFTTKTNGTGLGLPLVKRTVNAHGGIITVNSKKEEGTTFTLYLPQTLGT